jgi:hypothetical protein
MNPVMLAHLDEVRAAGALVAEDGAVIVSVRRSLTLKPGARLDPIEIAVR